VAVELDNADGSRVRTLASTAVTVTGVDTVGHAVTLAGDNQRQWTLHLTDAAMPSDFIKMGDAFDLAVDDDTSGATIGWINQNLTLSRGGQLIVFAADHSVSVPSLDAFGFKLSTSGPTCTTYQNPVSSMCSWSQHDIRVESGNESVVIGVGETAPVGGLTFTNGAFLTYSWCGDMPSVIRMAGFRSP
jgi:hypothetical protein